VTGILLLTRVRKQPETSKNKPLPHDLQESVGYRNFGRLVATLVAGGWTDSDPAETTGFGYRFGSSTSAIAPLIFASEINPEQNFHVFGFVDLVILQLQRFCQGGAADIPVAR
jgi:hypothetical protein